MVIKSINPRTEEIIKTYKEIEPKELNQIINQSKDAFKTWSKKPKHYRIKIVQEIKSNIIKNREKIKDIIYNEGGFFKEETDDIIADVIDGIDYYCNKYEQMKDIDFPIDKRVFPQTTAEVKYAPKGIIAQIGIWNYPLWQTMISTIPSLLTGNTVIYKPSEYATMIGLKIDEIINSTSIPKHVFTTVIGGKTIGKLLVKSESVSMVVYTGNINTGKDIIKNADIKSLLLELSGNDAAIVTNKCDIRKTTKGIASGSFLHSGEVCDRIKRIYVNKKISKGFIESFINYSKKYKIERDISPLIRKNAVEKAHAQVMKSLEDGARILLGGEIPETKGYYYPPTVLLAEKPSVYSLKEEIFAPVVTIYETETTEEAIELTNKSKYGLGASIWTENYDEAKRIAEKLDVGIIWINDSNIPLTLGEYFQGHKQSSIANADDRLRTFLNKKVIIENKQSERVWWF